jgi:hypothetical protein
LLFKWRLKGWQSRMKSFGLWTIKGSDRLEREFYGFVSEALDTPSIRFIGVVIILSSSMNCS